MSLTCISGPLALEGEYLWTLKDHIDRTWMDGYRNLKKGMSGGGIGGMLTALTSDHQSLQSVAENIGADAINLLLHSKMRHVCSWLPVIRTHELIDVEGVGQKLDPKS
jgi:hypothetical protein